MLAHQVHRCRPLLGTFVSIQIPEGENALEQIDLAFAIIQDVDQEASFFRQNNWLDRINRLVLNPPAAPWWADQLLQLCDEITTQSQGCFAPKHHGKMDLSGIAKGYAVDLAVEQLIKSGVECGVVNAGGDLRVFGNQSHEIQVISALDGQILKTLNLKNQAMATSVLQMRALEQNPRLASQGIRLQHPVGPMPLQVSVISDRCAVADALTKVIAHQPANLQKILSHFAAQSISFDLNRTEQRKMSRGQSQQHG